MTESTAATFAERAFAGDRSADVVDWLFDALQSWPRYGGEISLDRLLKLRSTLEDQRLARRNRALRRAAQLLSQPTARATYLAVESEWKRFVAGPLWQAWRDDPAPPPGASELMRVLFDASVANRSSARGILGLRRIRDIVEGIDEV